MIADRKDVQGSLEQRHQQRQAAMVPAARMLAAAAPIMDGLQRSPEWERYTQLLQGMLDRYAEQRKVAVAKLTDPTVTEDKDVRQLRHGIFLADVTIDTLTFAIRLPAEILKGAEAANQFVKEFEARDDQAADKAKP